MKGEFFKRITPEQAQNYRRLISGDPDLCKKAMAYTLTPCLEPGYEGWEDVTYYTDDSIPLSALHPLEIFLKDYDTIDYKKDLGE